MTEPATPRIVSRDEWERARAELLVREKAHTHAGDELAAARRRLPMTRMEPVLVVGPDGPVPLHVVFEGRRMRIVYHFMWKKGAPHHKQCEGCSKRIKRSGEGSRPCYPRCSCSTSLRTAGRKHGRTHPPDGRTTKL